MAKLLTFIVLTTTTSLLLGPALGYNTGCPKGCEIPSSPEPGHGSAVGDNANELNRYTITVNEISTGQYEVTLQGPPFKGFVMHVDGGMFENGPGIEVTQCGAGSSVTQSDPSTKNSVTAVWKQTQTGEFTFRATAVQDIHYAVINIVQNYTI